MKDNLRKAVLEAIDKAPDNKKLSEYFMKIAKKINPTRYEQSTVTMQDSMLQVLSDESDKFYLELHDEIFRPLSEMFYLTAGLHVIGAPSGHGKTFWAMKWAESAAKKNLPVLILSLEMSHKDLSARKISAITDIPLIKIIKREMSDVQKIIMREQIQARDYLKNIHIDTFGDYDWVKIYPRLIDRMIKLKPKLIVVDYVQMISNSEEDDIRTSKILGDIARELKLFADQHESAVLLLSQLNRDATKEVSRSRMTKLDNIPLATDHIKESGGIVEAADSVQLVCIPGRLTECPEHLRHKFQVSIQKSRRIGLLGTKIFNFNPEIMRFSG